MILDVKPNTKAAYELFHRGLEAFTDMERNGMRVDLDALGKTSKEAQALWDQSKKDLVKTPEYKKWVDWALTTGKDVKLNGDQIADFLFDVLKIEPLSYTERGNPQVNDDLLQDLDSPFGKALLTMRKMEKVTGTYLAQIKREQVDGVLHPVFNLHIADTFRSSADSPSFQNMPIRDETTMRLVRSVLYPRVGNQLGESDFKGIEVGVGICYHQDPTMTGYWLDPKKDMHRDTACDCFMLDPAQCGKKIRYVGKNGFVFPSFYGSAWAQIAPAMWKQIKRLKLKTEEGVPLFDHLADKGITKLGTCDFDSKPEKGTFARHILDVENIFWNERFSGYRDWKKKWFSNYLKRGYFHTLTGFTVRGVLRRNQVVNYPIQGDAFHCLLWTLIHLNDWLKKNQMGTRLIGQIHDSMVKDYDPREVAEVIEATQTLIKYNIRNEWKWITVPLEAEFELCPVNGSWADKKEIKIKDGHWNWAK